MKERYLNMKVPPEFYNKAVLSQPIEHQIDNLYEPKDKNSQKRISLMLNIIKPAEGDVILDIGCGVGTWAYHCAKLGAKSYGIDYSSESIKIAENLSKQFGVVDKTKFIVGRVGSLPFEDCFFDKVVSNSIIEHISHEEKDLMLKEMCRVLKDDGFILTITPNAIRDKIGLIWKRITFQKISKWDVKAHFGLISKRRYEKILKLNNTVFNFKYFDIKRPYLAVFPLINDLLSCNMLWVIRKSDKEK